MAVMNFYEWRTEYMRLGRQELAQMLEISERQVQNYEKTPERIPRKILLACVAVECNLDYRWDKILPTEKQ